jgi:hypothetical protein
LDTRGAAAPTPEGDKKAEEKAADGAAKAASDATKKRRGRSRTVLAGATAGPTNRLRTARSTLLGGNGSTLGS